jgi:hypothetical protein
VPGSNALFFASDILFFVGERHVQAQSFHAFGFSRLAMCVSSGNTSTTYADFHGSGHPETPKPSVPAR